jgi:hypothetical protein
MIEQAHRKAGVWNTLVITHRQELYDLIPQQVQFTENGIIQITE